MIQWEQNISQHASLLNVGSKLCFRIFYSLELSYDVYERIRALPYHHLVFTIFPLCPLQNNFAPVL